MKPRYCKRHRYGSSKAALNLLLSLTLLSSLPPSTLSSTTCPDDPTPTPHCTTSRYYKISDESNGLATSCAAVDQTADPLLSLSESSCQAACDALEGCNTVNFRWSDPNFGGESSCYRKNCDNFKTAVCTLFTQHKGRDVYTKACGAEELYLSHVEVDSIGGLFAGVRCPSDDDEAVKDVDSLCAVSGGASSSSSPEEDGDCSVPYYKISDQDNGLATSCAAVDQTADPVVGLSQTACQASCDALDGCNTINFRWSDPNFGGESTCYRKNCDDFKTAVCTLFTQHKGRDVYTKACGASDLYSKNVVTDTVSGLFAGVKCPMTCSPSDNPANTCVTTYYKISDEANGLATSCAAVDQTADPLRNLDEAGCQAACDAMEGCNTVNFRWRDPNFAGESTCYRKNCADFSTAVCTLFTNHKGRDVYTKACGASELYESHVEVDSIEGLFAGVKCPDPNESAVATVMGQCNDGTAPADPSPTCSSRYYKVSDQSNGLATSCAAVDQPADPVVGLSQAECQASCDAMEGCNTINFRWSDPNFSGRSTCYRKNCDDFTTAVCTLFTNHKGRDVYTKACGAAELFDVNVLGDATEGLFAGVKCPSSTLDPGESTGTCARFATTNRTDSTCDICYEQSSIGGSDNVRSCRLWERASTSATGSYTCRDYAPSVMELKQKVEYQSYLQKRWQKVGLCDLNYTRGTVCNLNQNGNECEVRDQPCQGDVAGLGGVAGVLSPGWRMTFSTEQDNHVCTMCGKGTYGTCDDACQYRRNFFWSGYNLGKEEVSLNAMDLEQLYKAFVGELPVEIYDVPQELKLTKGVLGRLSEDHPLRKLSSKSEYSIIRVGEVSVTVRDQLRYIYISLSGSKQSVPTTVSTAGVKVYETCNCKRCPRGQYQDTLGETSCKLCNSILPGSNTQDPGATGPQHCKCLWSDDVFLNGDESQCLPCDSVRNGTLAAPQGICECSPNTFEVVVPNGTLGAPQNTSISWVTCQSCPDFSSTFDAKMTMHMYGNSIENCYCMAGYYAKDKGCAQCPSMKTSSWNAQSANDCYLTDSTRLMAIVIPVGITLFVLLFTLMSLHMRRKIARLERERIRAMKEKIYEASESVNHLAHPMVLLTVKDFLDAGRMIKHEEARTRHMLITIDTTQELKGFRRTNKLLFFSHQWLAWGEPDPERIQYNAMKYAVESLLKKEKIDPSHLFVWLDYTCIPQSHRGLQRLSINSLPMYAGACDFFVIVAPGPITHKDTGVECDAKTYQDRAWCRAEQLSHGCRLGVERMFIAKGSELVPVTWDWIKPSFQIFNGNLTCCARNHDGMEQCDKEFLITPVLGLFCELLALEKHCRLPSQKKEVLQFMRENKEKVFPQRFEFSSPKGKKEERELFGDILTLLEEDMNEEDYRKHISFYDDDSTVSYDLKDLNDEDTLSDAHLGDSATVDEGYAPPKEVELIPGWGNGGAHADKRVSSITVAKMENGERQNGNNTSP